MTYYDVFKAGIKSPISQIKKEYLKIVREFHPDRYDDTNDNDLKYKVTSLFAFINKAFHTLSDEKLRAEYDATLLRKVTARKPTEEKKKEEKLKEDEIFKRGFAEFKRGNLINAMDLLRAATQINPQNASYWASLSIVLNKLPRRSKEAEETILRAIDLEPHNAEYYVHLGNIYVGHGLNKRAEEQFEKALKWDPTHKKALKELEKLKEKK
ncbi:MAG: DnaJ domain-containing protein [Nitrospirae bacterium]|nr:DnaJ domain-containing protein [Nitrospirota bacterium]